MENPYALGYPEAAAGLQIKRLPEATGLVPVASLMCGFLNHRGECGLCPVS
jgi:hypothetical protein